MRVSAFVLLLLGVPCWASEQSFLIIVSGIGGEPVYSERFKQWSEGMLDAAESRLGIAGERIVYLSEDAENASDRTDGRSVKTEIEAALSRVAEVSKTGDVVVLLLIGHGTARQDRALFNLPGPDLSPSQLDAMLASLAGRRLVIVNAAPSSAPFIEMLSAPDRIVITATANSAERYHTIFARHFVAAFARDGSDTDKNGRVSVLEAFEFARREVQRAYDSDGRLQTEHPLLDDNGDGAGSSDIEASDGALAGTTYLQTVSALAAAANQSESWVRLIRERADIEQKIEALKARKDRLDPALYEQQLEAFLVDLALTYRAIRAAQR